MSRNQTITCDAPNCGKDISQGDGRSFHLMVQGTRIGMKPDSEVIDTIAHPMLGNIDVTRHDAHDVIQQRHFCDFACLEAWAVQQQDDRHVAQEEHKTALIDRAQLLKNEEEARTGAAATGRALA